MSRQHRGAASELYRQVFAEPQSCWIQLYCDHTVFSKGLP